MAIRDLHLEKTHPVVGANHGTSHEIYMSSSQPYEARILKQFYSIENIKVIMKRRLRNNKTNRIWFHAKFENASYWKLMIAVY